MRSSSNSETRRNSGDIDVVEEVVPLVAGFGKWQFLMAGMLCFSVIPITWNYHAILFLAPSQQGYVCKYPEGLGFENWRLDDWITLSHPKHKVYSKESPNLEQCHMYKLNYSELVNATESEIDSLPTNQTEIIRCSEFLFFPARYGLTILQKLNLLCEDKSKMVLTEALFRIGLMLGNFIFGRMSDRFGRRLILLSSLICQPVAGTFTALSPTFTVYCVARFAFGFSLGGCVNMSFILVTETAANKWRSLMCGLFLLPYGPGVILLALLASLFRNATKLQLVISFPSALLLIFTRFIQESPIWLLDHRMRDSAENVLKIAAKFNKHHVPSSFHIRTVENLKVREKAQSNPNVFQLFKTPVLCKETVTLCMLWSVTSFSYAYLFFYYSISHQELHLNVIIAGGLVFVALICSCLCVCKFQHGRLILSQLLTTGVLALIALFFASEQNTDTVYHVLLLTALVTSAMSLSTLWNYTPRVFPTLLRGTGFGLCTMMGNAASIFTLVFIIDDSSATIPLGCVGVSCVLASVWVCLLPQVQGRELPETTMDTERFKSHSKPVRWTIARPVSASIEETEIRTTYYE